MTTSILPVQPIQQALLYENKHQFQSGFPAWEDLCARLNSALEGTTPAFRLIPGGTDATMALYSNDILHITVERMDHQMALQGFAVPLSQPFYTQMQPQLVAGVKSHQSGVLINVGLGPFPMPLDHKLFAQIGLDSLPGGAQDQEKYELRLLIAQAIGAAVCGFLMPSVVHWGQSDQLLAGASYHKLAQSGFCLPLYIHPGFSGSGAKVGDSFCMGVNAFGAHQMIGKHVVFEEHPQVMGRSFEEVLAFIAYCRSIGRILEDNETFGTKEGAKIEVRHLPGTEQHPWGVIRLRKRAPNERPARPTASFNAAEKQLGQAIKGQRNALSGKSARAPRDRLIGGIAVLGRGISLARITLLLGVGMILYAAVSLAMALL